MTDKNPFANAPLVYTYSRAQAIEDGVLIDVTATAEEAGIRFPTAVTAALWETVVATPEAARRHGESDEGRLWDVLWILRVVIREMADAKSDAVYFSVLATNEKGRKVEHRLYAKCGPGDSGEPVVTVMMVGED
jgi:hypothetical protein